MSNSYYDKLKDPKWQKKRLEILNRDNFTCQSCMSDDNTLHVHHKSYDKGREPWDYPNTCFITLCEECHGVEQHCLKESFSATKDLLINSDITNSGYIEIVESLYQYDRNGMVLSELLREISLDGDMQNAVLELARILVMARVEYEFPSEKHALFLDSISDEIMRIAKEYNPKDN